LIDGAGLRHCSRIIGIDEKQWMKVRCFLLFKRPDLSDVPEGQSSGFAD
jgi:hypothetical protein